MRIKSSGNRLSWDVEDFITGYELERNQKRKHFEALLKAKFEALEIMAEEYFQIYLK